MRNPKVLNVTVWTVQVLLALFFALASGAPKLLLPPEMIPMPIPLAHSFVLFIGSCEVLGALGLVLPGIFRIARGLTPLAATGLVIIMIGATVINVIGGAFPVALITLVIGLLAAFVAYGRRQATLLRRPNGSASSESAYRSVSTL